MKNTCTPSASKFAFPRLFVYGVMLLLWSVAGISCTHKDEVTYRVALSQCSDDAWRRKMNEEMQIELLFHPEISLEIRSAGDDSERQSADIDYFIAQKVDLLIVSPNEPDGLTAAVSRAYDAGIPVIVADRRIHGDKYTAFIGGDNRHVGKLIAGYLRSVLPKGGRIVEMRGLEGSTPSVLRHEGMMAGLEGTNIEIAAVGQGEWFRQNAKQEMLRIIRTTHDIDVVVAQNDQMAIGAWEAVHEALPNSHIRFVGVDALSGDGNGLEALMNGKIDMSVSYLTAGDLIIRTASQILAGEPFLRDTVIPAVLVDRNAAVSLEQLYRQERHEVQSINMLEDHVDLYKAEYRRHLTILWLLVGFAVVAVIFLVYYLRLYRQRKRLSEELMEAQQNLKEETGKRLTFFTNVSHDFRTPLTLIADPISRLTHDASLNEAQHALARLAERNAQVLLRLINQVLDLRKAESGLLSLNNTTFDFALAIRNWTEAFLPLAQKRHVSLSHSLPATASEKPLWVVMDAPKTERIFFNLIANAFKFTPENGSVDVVLTEGKDTVTVKVCDTGSGIPDEYKEQIFDTFYQVDAANSQGSGLGLALVKSFVTLQGGTITVANNPAGQGTVFTVVLPKGDVKDIPATNTPLVNITMEQIMIELNDERRSSLDIRALRDDSTKPVLLIIDDNSDILTYLTTIFEEEYIVLTEKDGRAGLRRAFLNVPDVIISDISMPELDGLEACRILKGDVVTSHIPVLLLTARTLDEQQVEGYEHGADAYVSKPFKAEVLIAQVRSLLDNRIRVRNAFSTVQTSSQTNDTKTSAAVKATNAITAEEQFVERFRKRVLELIDDSSLSVETLSVDLGLSRTQLFRKIKALTTYSPNEYIRNIRLMEAQKLLHQGKMSVSEVAYSTGFTSPSYFTKCYTEFFHEKPSQSA